MQQHIVIFGHSHVWSLKRAAEGRPSSSLTIEVPLCGTEDMPGPIVYQDAAGKDCLTSTIVALLNRLKRSPEAETTWLLSAVQGNYYNQLGMVITGGPFDFVLKEAPELPLTEGATLIPYNAMRGILSRFMAEQQIYLRLMKKTDFAKRLMIFGPPPPPKDDAAIRALLQKQQKQTEITPPFVRLKLWKLQNELHSEWCAANDLTFLSGAIEQAQDAEGFLRPEYVKDAAHANHTWAGLFLDKAAAVVTAGRTG